MQIFILMASLLVMSHVYAEDFSSLLSRVESHPAITAAQQNYKMRASQAEAQSALKDPMLKLSAMNVPESSLSFDKTPMSSKQVALSQTIPLTTRLSHIGDQSEYLEDAGKKEVQYQVFEARAGLWIMAAKLESLQEQLNIVKESLSWVSQVEKSTQRLYSTGKTNQINLLEIKVRKADLETQEQELIYKMAEVESQIGFLVGEKKPLAVTNTPWNRLEQKKADSQQDAKESSLKSEVQAANSKSKAANLAYVPDMTLGAAYSFRENVDGQGNFVSAFVQFSIPLWGETSSKSAMAKSELGVHEARLQNYQIKKSKQIHSLSQKISSLSKEVELTTQSISFANTERELATKRYSLGKMNVFDLLEVELKLRNKKLKKENLKENLREAKVELLLLQGDDLNV